MMKKMKWLAFTLFILLAFAGLAGCNTTEEQPKEDTAVEQQNENQANETEQEAVNFPVTITDATGAEVVIEEEPERIISIIPSATEIAFSLGIGDKIVGVSDWDNYPEEVNEIEKVGGLDVSTEKIVSLEPDLVLANSSNGNSIEALRNIDVTVLVVDANSLDETFESIRMIAKATGTKNNAEEIIAKMEGDRDEIINVVKEIPEEERKKVWVEVSQDLYTAGKGTFMNELIELAGGTNIMSDQEGWPQVSEETVIEKNPDVIFITYGYYIENAAEQVKDRENWKSVNAIKEEQVFELDSDMVNRPGPRITQGLKQIAAYLYPDKFAE
mgnify:CR=1 FL=1